MHSTAIPAGFAAGRALHPEAHVFLIGVGDRREFV